MASLDEDWKLPAAVQPKPHDYAYDLDRALSSVVGLSSQVPPMLSQPKCWARSGQEMGY